MSHPLCVIVGPTGSGKSSLAHFLASRFNGELVNCDSIQIFRRFDIGSAKTPAHLIDIADPEDLFTAGDYARKARAVLEEIKSRNRLPVIVGGTGFYLRALLDGLFEGPERDENIRARLIERQRARPGSLHRILKRLDAASAARIHPNDINKTIRALEVCLLSRRPLSKMFEQGRDPLTGFDVMKIGLNPPRDALYARLDRRFVHMIENGLLDEVRNILASGVSPAAKPFESLGYKQALAVVRHQMPLDAATSEAQMETRRYAKRQMTWFRREKDVTWFNNFGDDEQTRKEAASFVERKASLTS